MALDYKYQEALGNFNAAEARRKLHCRFSKSRQCDGDVVDFRKVDNVTVTLLIFENGSNRQCDGDVVDFRK